MKHIALIPPTWDAPLLAELIARATKSRSVRIQNRLYYPYYFFYYRLRGKMLFTRVNSQVGCTVDLISGKEALVDALFEVRSETVPCKWVLEGKLTEERARQQAKSYVYAAVSRKVKFLGSVELLQEGEFLHYRPFLLAACEGPDKVPTIIIVDGVSGRFHPLPSEKVPYVSSGIS